MGLTIDLLCIGHFVKGRGVCVAWREDGCHLLREALNGRLGATISCWEGAVLKAYFEVTSSLVVLDSLGDGASDRHWVSLVVVVNVLYGLKIVGFFAFVSFLQSKVVCSQVFRSFTIIGGTLSALCLRYEFFFGFRSVINTIFVAKLDISGFEIHGGMRIFPELS